MENKKNLLDEQKEKMDKKQNMLNLIFAETLTRHSNLTEEEFLKKINFDTQNISEQRAIRIAIFNLCMALTNQFIKARGTFTTAKNILKFHLIDEEEKGEKNNGRK